ncbi:MAG: hypothetical protein WDN69_05125 [Aliidongia sp.]
MSVGKGIPIEGPFVPLRLELLRSLAYKGLSINARRLLDFLMVEQLQHAGLENGRLLATYDQLQRQGIGRSYIPKAISDLEERGLVVVDRRPRKSFTESYPLLFRLTFVQHQVQNEKGTKYWVAPTNDWRTWSETAAEDRANRCNDRVPRQSTIENSGKPENPASQPIPHGAQSSTMVSPESEEISQISVGPMVLKGEPLSISREDEGSASLAARSAQTGERFAPHAAPAASQSHQPRPDYLGEHRPKTKSRPENQDKQRIRQGFPKFGAGECAVLDPETVEILDGSVPAIAKTDGQVADAWRLRALVRSTDDGVTPKGRAKAGGNP